MRPGKVYLVGSGPGDPGLITVKGLECIRKAEVLVYDHLIGEELLREAPAAAEKIYVGKEADKHALEQEDINHLLVEKGGQGKVVVRLKGGDPFVLGRGGEEGEALRRSGISFEVVPGITSAVAVPAYAGIPVTQRGMASSFAVITGHEDPTKDRSSIKWEKLATGVDTLVFLMGLANLPLIAGQLVKYGRPASTPVALIRNGTRPDQQTVVGTLADIDSKAREQGLRPPAVIVVGDVVKMREQLRWFDNRPLSGKRVLVTRSRHQASELSRLLAERGAQPVEMPVIEIEPVVDTSELDSAIRRLVDYNWLVFTSANGVEAFFARLEAMKLDSRYLKDVEIGVIGPATGKALQRRGLIADYTPEVYTSDGFVAGLKDRPVAGKRFLLLRADLAGKELAEGIVRLGGKVDDVTVYRTAPAKEAGSDAGEVIAGIDVITFASSSTVNNLMKVLGGDARAVNGARIACIGPVTAATAEKNGLKVDILAEEQTIPGLVRAIEKYFEGGQ